MRSVVPWILVASPIAISSFGCWGATQVTVALSTDLACDGTIDTLLYKGLPKSLDSNPNAETKSCTASTQLGADNDIGTLTLTPSGEKNAQVEVKAVLARNGKDPAKCTSADSADCIIATRTFSFSEHASQRISIRLLADCIGTVCPEGQTCVSAGVCTSNAITCTAPDGCPDGGADNDGGAPAGVCETRGKNKSGELARTSAVPADQLSTLVRARGGSRGAIVWFGADGLYSVPTDGSNEAVPIGSDRPVALTDGRDGKLVAIGAGPPTVFYRGTDSRPLTTVVDPLTVAATTDLALIGSSRGVSIYAPSSSGGPTGGVITEATPVSTTGASRVATTDKVGFAASDDGVHVINLVTKKDVTPAPQTRPLVSMGASPAIFAVTPGGGRAFVAGLSTAAQKVVIVDLLNDNPVASTFRLPTNAPIVSLATDDKYVYFTHGNDGITAVDGDNNTTVAATVSATIANVAVDDTCLYFWQVESPTSSVLRAVTKPK